MTTPDPAEALLAEALHRRCLDDWQADALLDPDRALTMHEVDAHWDDVYGLAANTPGATLLDAARLGLGEPDRSAIRAAISNAYYEARNEGRTMEQAADDATDAVLTAIRRALGEQP